MENNNFVFLTYGLLAAWLLLFASVARLVHRERRIRTDIEALKQALEDLTPSTAVDVRQQTPLQDDIQSSSRKTPDRKTAMFLEIGPELDDLVEGVRLLQLETTKSLSRPVN